MTNKYPYTLGDEPVPGYRVVRFLGKGNFGEVWQVQAPGGTSAAIKIIPDLSSKQAHKEFRALGITKNLHHPNLVPVHAVWLKDGEGKLLDDSMAADKLLPPVADTKNLTPVRGTVPLHGSTPDLSRCELIVAMGLGHKNLFNRLEECLEQGETGIPVEELLNYMEEAAKAIDYLNQDSFENGTRRAGVQHCDIKPHNILIAGSAAQVCDFGLARVQGEVRATTSMSATVAYAAPECLQGTGDPSPTTDQYSLAITYYELRTGLLPYEGETISEVLQASIQGQLNLSQVSEREQAVLRQATSLDPSRRYRNTLSMVRALRHAVEAGPEVDSGPDRPPVPPTPSQPIAWLLAAVALLATLGTGSWWLLFRTPDSIPSDTTEVAHGDGKPPVTPTPPSVIPEPPQKVPSSDELTSREKLAAAEEKMKQAAELLEPNPDEASANQKAVEIYADVIQSAPSLAPQALCERGKCQRKLGKGDLAIRDFSKAIELAPNFALAYSRRGKLYLDRDELPAALQDLKRAVELEHDPVDVLNLGIAYSLNVQFELALPLFGKLIQARPDDAEARFQRGLIYQELTLYPEAETDLRQALAARSDHYRAMSALATLLAGLPDATSDQGDEALVLATKAMDGEQKAVDDFNREHSTQEKKKEVSADYPAALAAALARTGDFARAVEEGTKAVKQSVRADEAEVHAKRLKLYQAGKTFDLPKPDQKKRDEFKSKAASIPSSAVRLR